MKKFRLLTLWSFLSLAMWSCTPKDDGDDANVLPTDEKGRVIISGDITENRTLTKDKKYIVRNYVYVKSGVTLTIEAGTTIFGDKDTKGTLIVSQGGKLIAEGTANAPIVFTSAQPKGSRAYGDWGGVVLIGKAPVNRPEANRIPEGGIAGTYGGSDANDNSGTLKYVRIEFAGIALSTTTNSEINGLTLYGVGKGTKIEYVQVSYSGDDSFEWFGGTVDAKYLVAHRGWDDDFDTDFGYSGNVQFGVALRDPAKADQSSSNGFESDNYDPGTVDANNGNPLTSAKFANMSVFLTDQTSLPTSTGSGNHQRGMHLRRNTNISVYNSMFVGHPEGLRLDGNMAWANAQSTLKLEGVYLINNTTALKNANPSGETATSGFNAQGLADWFNGAGKKNSTINNANIATAKLNANTFSLTAPNFRPQSDSPLLTIANAATVPSGLTQANYIGAFGTNDWTAGWANFDPQNTEY